MLLNTILPNGLLQLNYFIDTDMVSKSCISFELLNLEQKILLTSSTLSPDISGLETGVYVDG